ncbi:hypothetical protein ACKKBG_A24795 [Auxenochlorella protothecoides x Auxenochlorella symbiontica]
MTPEKGTDAESPGFASSLAGRLERKARSAATSSTPSASSPAMRPPTTFSPLSRPTPRDSAGSTVVRASRYRPFVAPSAASASLWTPPPKASRPLSPASTAPTCTSSGSEEARPVSRPRRCRLPAPPKASLHDAAARQGTPLPKAASGTITPGDAAPRSPPNLCWSPFVKRSPSSIEHGESGIHASTDFHQDPSQARTATELHIHLRRCMPELQVPEWSEGAALSLPEPPPRQEVKEALGRLEELQKVAAALLGDMARDRRDASPSNVVSSARAQATLGMLAARQRGLARRAEPVPLIPPAVQARLSRLAELRAEAAALLSAPPLPLIASH